MNICTKFHWNLSNEKCVNEQWTDNGQMDNAQTAYYLHSGFFNGRAKKNTTYQLVTVTYDRVQFIEPVVQITKQKQMMEVVWSITEVEILWTEWNTFQYVTDVMISPETIQHTVTDTQRP